MFFSHVIKAQPYSMPLLDMILQKNISLYDYECITEKGLDDTKRLVAFGRFAGQAGITFYDNFKQNFHYIENLRKCNC